MSLAEKLQSLRNQRGISQDALAAELRVTRQDVSAWELGDRVPDVDTLVKLSEALDVSLDELLKDKSVSTRAEPVANSQWANTRNEDSAFDFDEFETESRGFTISFKRGLYPLATLIFLGLGFIWGLWHPGWLVFVAAWIVEEIIDWVKTGKFGFSIYGVAGIGFILMGFVFGLWSHAWLIFIAAWAIDEMLITPNKKKKKKKKKHHN